MAIEFYCSQCRNRLRVDDSAAGRQARCPVCNAIMIVPAVGVIQEPPGAVRSEFEGYIPSVGPTPVSPPPPGTMGGTTLGSGRPGPEPATYQPHVTPQHYGEVVGRSAEKREEGWGGAALVLGLFGLIAWCCPIIGVVIGGLALVFGIVSLGKGGGPMAIIGLILGIICLVLSIFNALLGMALMLADAEVVSLVMTDL